MRLISPGIHEDYKSGGGTSTKGICNHYSCFTTSSFSVLCWCTPPATWPSPISQPCWSEVSEAVLSYYTLQPFRCWLQIARGLPLKNWNSYSLISAKRKEFNLLFLLPLGQPRVGTIANNFHFSIIIINFQVIFCPEINQLFHSILPPPIPQQCLSLSRAHTSPVVAGQQQCA